MLRCLITCVTWNAVFRALLVHLFTELNQMFGWQGFSWIKIVCKLQHWRSNISISPFRFNHNDIALLFPFLINPLYNIFWMYKELAFQINWETDWYTIFEEISSPPSFWMELTNVAPLWIAFLHGNASHQLLTTQCSHACTHHSTFCSCTHCHSFTYCF